MLLIPAIDLLDGRCVRLHQGDFARETRYSATPYQLLQRYQDIGARYVHIVDLDGARYGKRTNHSLITGLAVTSRLELQVGGGVRRAAAIDVLLHAGASRVVIGSAAAERPEEVVSWIRHFGPERVVLAFDVRVDGAGMPHVHTHGWTRTDRLTLWDALAAYQGIAHHVLCTDIGRDGTLAGPNFDLYRVATARFPGFSWQASGGVRDTSDLSTLARMGISAAVTGKALLEERINPEELRLFLPDASFPALTSATAE